MTHANDNTDNATETERDSYKTILHEQVRGALRNGEYADSKHDVRYEDTEVVINLRGDEGLTELVSDLIERRLNVDVSQYYECPARIYADYDSITATEMAYYDPCPECSGRFSYVDDDKKERCEICDEVLGDPFDWGDVDATELEACLGDVVSKQIRDAIAAEAWDRAEAPEGEPGYAETMRRLCRRFLTDGQKTELLHYAEGGYHLEAWSGRSGEVDTSQ